MTSRQSFRARMKIRDGNPYVDISTSRARALKPGWRRPLPVLVRVNGQPASTPWRINLMPTGTGAFYLYLHGDVRRASRTKVGDRVAVDVEFDAWLKSPAAHERNVARAIHVLSGKGGRFMARSW